MNPMHITFYCIICIPGIGGADGPPPADAPEAKIRIKISNHL